MKNYPHDIVQPAYIGNPLPVVADETHCYHYSPHHKIQRTNV